MNVDKRPENYQGRRRAVAKAGAHRAPAFARGAHAAPASIQAGQTATATVFGVTAAAVALGSAAAGSDTAEPAVGSPQLDNTATQHTTDAAGQASAEQALADDASGQAEGPRNDAVRAITTPMPKVSIRPAAPGAAKPGEKVVVKTAKAQAVARRAIAARRAKVRFSHPLPGAAVTSCFGQRWGALHAGIDFAKPAGTAIHAVQAGQVVAAGWNYGGYGISVMLRHADGTLTHYAHMQKTAVHAGQRVRAGAVLGYEGSTGDSTGPHLHFEVHKGMWNQVNPVGWLAARGIRAAC